MRTAVKLALLTRTLLNWSTFMDYRLLADQAVPNLSTIAARPGPGEKYYRDPDDKLTIASGALVVPTGQFTESGEYWPDALTREPGLCFALHWETGAQSNYPYIGLCDIQYGMITVNVSLGFYMSLGNVLPVVNGAVAVSVTPFTVTANEDLYTWLIARGLWGGFILTYRENDQRFVLVWYDEDGYDAAVYANVRLTLSSAVATSSAKIHKSGVLNLNDAGYPHFGERDLAAQQIQSSPPVGIEKTMTPDSYMRITVDTVPSASSIQIAARRIDNNDSWVWRIDAAGIVILTKVEDASASDVANSGAVTASNGSIIEMTMLDNVYTCWIDGALGFTHTDAGRFNVSETIGRVTSVGTGGAVSDWRLRTLNSEVLNADSQNYAGPGIATDFIVGPMATNDTFTHEANGWLDFWLHALPSGSNLRILFRMVDASNFLELRITPAGDLNLRKTTTGGGDQSIYSQPGVLSGGEHIRVLFDGTRVQQFYDTTSGAAQTVTENQAGTGGKVAATSSAHASNLIAWPRAISGAAARPLQEFLDR